AQLRAQNSQASKLVGGEVRLRLAETVLKVQAGKGDESLDVAKHAERSSMLSTPVTACGGSASCGRARRSRSPNDKVHHHQEEPVGLTHATATQRRAERRGQRDQRQYEPDGASVRCEPLESDQYAPANQRKHTGSQGDAERIDDDGLGSQGA